MEYPFSVVHEDNHLLIVNKQNGILTQGDDTGDPCLTDYVKDYLKHKYNKQGAVFCGLIHRLDRPVSGLVALAKTSKALERMNTLFSSRNVEKTYWAISNKAPAERQGTLKHWLVKDNAKNLVRAYDKEVTNGQYAELNYTLIAAVKKFYLIEIKPLTGRSHQIRVQLASMGCAICGDSKYGSPVELANPRGISLHAHSLQFVHPIQKENLKVQAPLPKEPLWNLFEKVLLL